jgi:hypothetical protein
MRRSKTTFRCMLSAELRRTVSSPGLSAAMSQMRLRQLLLEKDSPVCRSYETVSSDWPDFVSGQGLQLPEALYSVLRRRMHLHPGVFGGDQSFSIFVMHSSQDSARGHEWQSPMHPNPIVLRG